MKQCMWAWHQVVAILSACLPILSERGVLVQGWDPSHMFLELNIPPSVWEAAPGSLTPLRKGRHVNWSSELEMAPVYFCLFEKLYITQHVLWQKKWRICLNSSWLKMKPIKLYVTLGNFSLALFLAVWPSSIWGSEIYLFLTVKAFILNLQLFQMEN